MYIKIDGNSTAFESAHYLHCRLFISPGRRKRCTRARTSPICAPASLSHTHTHAHTHTHTHSCSRFHPLYTHSTSSSSLYLVTCRMFCGMPFCDVYGHSRPFDAYKSFAIIKEKLEGGGHGVNY